MQVFIQKVATFTKFYTEEKHMQNTYLNIRTKSKYKPYVFLQNIFNFQVIRLFTGCLPFLQLHSQRAESS